MSNEIVDFFNEHMAQRWETGHVASHPDVPQPVDPLESLPPEELARMATAFLGAALRTPETRAMLTSPFSSELKGTITTAGIVAGLVEPPVGVTKAVQRVVEGVGRAAEEINWHLNPLARIP